MSFNNRNQLKRSMSCERLEERWTPAQFGIPWPDSTHLTLSFVSDGTQIETEASQLQASLDAQMPRATWQQTILKASQAWAAAANVNIGLVTDGGQRLGISGATQGDTRFGDIRVAGLPLGTTHWLSLSLRRIRQLAHSLATSFLTHGRRLHPQSSMP